MKILIWFFSFQTSLALAGEAPGVSDLSQKGSKEFGCEESLRLPEWLSSSNEFVFKTGKWHIERPATETSPVRGTCLWVFTIRPPAGKQMMIHQQSVFANVNLVADSSAHFRMETFSPGSSGSKMDEPLKAPSGVLKGERLLKGPMRLIVRCGETAQIRINASVVLDPRPLSGKTEIDVVHAVLGFQIEDCPTRNAR
ncbi:MAG: hypothetical protein JNL01_05445 [Bdellovibrionales bacterium]|nr:hypothetical protein [Bdellovibrionales bacterium]